MINALFLGLVASGLAGVIASYGLSAAAWRGDRRGIAFALVALILAGGGVIMTLVRLFVHGAFS